MANVNFKKGLLANLPGSYSEGTFYVTTDERALYLDISGTERIRFGDFQEFATLAALKANPNPSTSALYYIAEMNCLAKWNGTEYIQINLDTGATSFEVVGDGNAITAVSYDAVTRKLTLTKGETFATRAYVGEIPEGYAEETIIAYINKKAEETLNAASGGSSESAASVLAALNTYKAENDPKVQALEAKAHEHANKDLLDTYTQTEADLADAVAKKHDHENAEELAKIASGDKAKWDAMEQNAKDYAKEYADGLAPNYDAAGSASAVQGKLDEEVLRAKAAEEANAAAAKAADDKAVAAQGEIDALEAKVGEVPADKTVVQMIADAQSAATYDDTQVKADIKSNADAIALLNDGSAVAGSVDYKIAQAVAAIMENPDETMNSINELVTWCNDHAADALALSNQVSTNKDDIAALELLVGETAVATQITNAIASALKIDGVDKYALASDLTAAIARIAAMEAKVSKWDAAEQNAKDHADSLNEAMGARMLVVEGKAHEHTFNEAELNKIVEGDVAKWNAAQANAEATAAAALSAAKSELEGKIADAQSAAEKVANDNNSAMDVRVKALEAIDHDAYKAYADQAESDAVATANAYADGLADNYDAAGSAATAETNAKAYADSLVMTWGSF